MVAGDGVPAAKRRASATYRGQATTFPIIMPYAQAVTYQTFWCFRVLVFWCFGVLVGPPAPKVLGSDTKTHLESRCCVQAILMYWVKQVAEGY